MSSISTHNQRLDMRIDLETKQMAERSSAALGCSSLTEYITRLIRDNSPSIIQQQTQITLSNQQFDQFITLCEDETIKPSKSLLQVAQQLDKEGY
ncbi:antitoxin [Bathymodiolus japonicus methanotrophic gill symbiont]|uniref:type II toxin-antitoxin system TacA family antitoxin n=1 Tax=Bathymodiolus japonicus methanotrophic gill symbiont TaxID=113269 RepID=UPI001B7AB812|nr:DUF1778 domain-containing protein [Bathymodiolus japonicus methanotrophic gill symbiont]GFO73314.1 antitoxin [Bathymodiolus japonicus methanotrophic gill symbiont]